MICEAPHNPRFGVIKQKLQKSSVECVTVGAFYSYSNGCREILTYHASDVQLTDIIFNVAVFQASCRQMPYIFSTVNTFYYLTFVFEYLGVIVIFATYQAFKKYNCTGQNLLNGHRVT